MITHITLRTKAAIAATVTAGIGLTVTGAVMAAASDENTERTQSADASAAASRAPVGRQNLETERDPSDPLEARSIVRDQIHADYSNRGLASIRTTGPKSLTVNWKNRAPQEIRDAFASRPFGVTIRLVEGANYSREETARATQPVVNHPDAQNLWKVVGAGGDGNGTGIVVFLTRKDPSPETRHAIAQAAGIPLTDITFTFEKSAPTPLLGHHE
ncbi:hypothetical protein ACHAAC_06295 [Aeromicrobium sp. CF4.19]|uniref:hypothetical protein n=1 Tax=Aeromicrobium sp. CF4.19 TaxID=3373082 RepID=UPI003EE6347C